MKKILLLTHNDMDGSGPVIIAKTAFGKENVEVIHCTNANMDEEIRSRCTVENDYDYIFITDISCSVETATMINDGPCVGKVFLLDHHRTALELNRFPWCHVEIKALVDSVLYTYGYTPEKASRMASGTSNFLDFLRRNKNTFKGDGLYNPSLSIVVNAISAYDTWDWVNVFDKDETYINLNRVFYLDGAEKFENFMLSKIDKGSIKNNSTLLNKAEEAALVKEMKNIKEYCDKKVEKVLHFNALLGDREYSISYTTAEKYTPDVIEAIAQAKPADIYILQEGNKLSLRTRSDDIDVSALAASIGGGGHKQAAGCYVTENAISLMLSALFETVAYENRIA